MENTVKITSKKVNRGFRFFRNIIYCNYKFGFLTALISKMLSFKKIKNVNVIILNNKKKSVDSNILEINKLGWARYQFLFKKNHTFKQRSIL
ncbi:hypothetical protein FFL01_03590 [Flavobacterium flevense]|uniref:Uncharacterized protein n=1 Tax=Flavobacterium flevense TaxID=983 RepID=A0A4Y4AUV5_9FLAO|nr:hypothetical protein FFL01_03590 [Flavobacterium flevense]